ncbi:MAG: ABC transporter permease [Deltaproteobacteria bacterium]|jgi:spermidine/putrescine transport system permease protein|nr:ABC transporter permease [Deltaproteobacteria bacterium]
MGHDGAPKIPGQGPRTVVWLGELTTYWRLRLRSLAMAGPPLLWLTLLLAVPCLLLGCLAFASRGQYGEIVFQATAVNLKRLIGYTTFGWSPAFLYIMARSLWVALVTTVLCVALAYPLTFHIATRPPKKRVYWLILLIIPFWTNVVIRAYAWLLILGPQMPPAKIAAVLGLIGDGASLYPGPLAVYLGMVSTFLPFMALPLYASVERINWEILEAAKDLYGSRYMIFMQAVLPQTKPGLYVGIIVTFVPSMAMFVVTDILGGAKTMLIGNLIQQQFAQARDWPFGAALSAALMLLTLMSLAVFRWRRRDGNGGGSSIFGGFD